MCVTAEPAIINSTRTYVYATELGGRPVHVCGYQNEARTLDGGNCMFLNFAGSDLRLVRGPEHTRRFMRDMTDELPELIEVMRMLGGSFSFGGSPGFAVEDYGDCTVILAQGPGDILSVLDQVPVRRRPAYSSRLRDMVDFYMSWYGQDSFVLACFDGSVNPKHPITVSHQPRNADVLTIPGLDGHDGKVPTVGAPVYRDFKVAFAVNGVQLPYAVQYDDRVAGMSWAPSSVTGFADNRSDGPNGDYVVPVEAVRQGLQGRELAAALL
jgi:hypothetical protein